MEMGKKEDDSYLETLKGPWEDCRHIKKENSVKMFQPHKSLYLFREYAYKHTVKMALH